MFVCLYLACAGVMGVPDDAGGNLVGVAGPKAPLVPPLLLLRSPPPARPPPRLPLTFPPPGFFHVHIR